MVNETMDFFLVGTLIRRFILIVWLYGRLWQIG
jgi:hypothetical protein